MGMEWVGYGGWVNERKCYSQFVRVVKESDSKSDGFTRAGSNPAADVNFCLFPLFNNSLFLLIYLERKVIFNLILFFNRHK